MTPVSRSVRGFMFSAVSAGIKKKTGPDLALIYSSTKATAAAVFTKNAIKAAPVYVSADRIKSGYCQAIIINSGNANCATGEAGIDDAKSMAFHTAQCLNLDQDDVLVASTGVIGVRLDIAKVKGALPKLCNALGADRIDDFAEAIMTTDTFAKVSYREVKAGDKTISVCGVAKGSGMIMPNMATMLGFVMTDACVERQYLRDLLKESVDETFNTVTVDGDTSTNDMVLIMANGESQAAEITGDSPIENAFREAVRGVMYDLSVMIARDGEGATKLIRITTTGAHTKTDAENVSRRIANSPLVKTAFFGEDANVGRLLMAIGNAGAKIYPNEIDIFINGIRIVSKSMVTPTENDENITKALKGKEIEVTVNLNVGHEKAEVLTCDMTYDYIKINSAYTT